MSQQEEKEMDDEFEGKIRKVIADVPQKHSEQENEGIPEDKVTVSLVKPRKEPEHDPLGKWAQISDGKLL
ncbi:MAG: hypothetical protein MMC33_007971, partial [Icmadophila ericetorum]|nr:hypothetical protein [Icmadophila ericetorum]